MTLLELGFVVVVVALLGAAAFFAQMFARQLPAAPDRPELPPTKPAAPSADAGEGDSAPQAPSATTPAAVEPQPETSAQKPARATANEPIEGAADADADATPAGADDPTPAGDSEPTGLSPTAALSPGRAAQGPGQTDAADASTSSGGSLFAPPSLFDPPSASGAGLSSPKLDVPKISAPKRDASADAPARVEFPKVEAPVQMPVDKPKVDAGKLAEKREEDEGARYRRGLLKTRKGFISRLANLFRGKPKVDDDLKDDVEEVLFTADIGAKTAQRLLARVTEVLDRKDVADTEAVWGVIRSSVLETIDLDAAPLDYAPDPGPYVLLMIGVNGVGKTTTIGKLAARHAEQGRKVLVVAGDTFRAAAMEQLEVWSKRVGCEIHAGAQGADPSSVIFDGIMRARNEGFDVVLCDTAGRLHTRKELMDELQKIRRSSVKALSKGRDAEVAPHDIFLVLDATIGQNALSQAQLFKETMDFSGLVLTKLDGTAKGGVVLGICDELRVPIRFIGIGEGIDDLRDFDAATFADALLTRPEADAEAADA